jgi:hypothetical protein
MIPLPSKVTYKEVYHCFNIRQHRGHCKGEKRSLRDTMAKISRLDEHFIEGRKISIPRKIEGKINIP